MSTSYYLSPMVESALKLQLQFQRQMQPMIDSMNNIMRHSLQPIFEASNMLNNHMKTIAKTMNDSLQGAFQPPLDLINQLHRMSAPSESIQRLMEQSYRQQLFWFELFQSLNVNNEPVFVENCPIAEPKEPTFSETVTTYIHRCRNSITEKYYSLSFADKITIIGFFTGFTFIDLMKLAFRYSNLLIEHFSSFITFVIKLLLN